MINTFHNINQCIENNIFKLRNKEENSKLLIEKHHFIFSHTYMIHVSLQIPNPRPVSPCSSLGSHVTLHVEVFGKQFLSTTSKAVLSLGSDGSIRSKISQFQLFHVFSFFLLVTYLTTTCLKSRKIIEIINYN